MNLILTVVLAGALTVPLIARASPGRTAPATLFAAAAPLAAVAAVVLTIITALLAGPLAIIPALPAALLLGLQLPRRRPPPPAAAESEHAVTLRVVSLNVLAGRVSPDVIVAEVDRLRPDVFAVQELTRQLADSLQDSRLPELLRYSCLQPGPGGRGIGIYSRWPLTDITAVSATRRPMPRVTLDPGQPVTITLVHPHAPVADRQQFWFGDMARLLASLPEVTNHHLLIGDFNATRDLRPFRRLLDAGFADSSDVASRRPWPGLTFPANVRIPPFMRLDHILVSPTGALVHETRHLRVPGTDHLGVFAVMDLQPVTTAAAAPGRQPGAADEAAASAAQAAPAAD
jgi:endonuclease/exonuclease/phosphatase (EEP) superfamily protein YafD